MISTRQHKTSVSYDCQKGKQNNVSLIRQTILNISKVLRTSRHSKRNENEICKQKFSYICKSRSYFF